MNLAAILIFVIAIQGPSHTARVPNKNIQKQAKLLLHKPVSYMKLEGPVLSFIRDHGDYIVTTKPQIVSAPAKIRAFLKLLAGSNRRLDIPKEPGYYDMASDVITFYYLDGLKRTELVDGAMTTLVWDGSDYLQGRS